MKTLILIRHAKSSWENYSSDFNRDLITVGITNSKLMASFTNSLLSENAVIFSSSAVRAKKTCLLFNEVWNRNLTVIQFSTDLYTFDSLKLTNFIRNCSNSIENLIIFGHNPAITEFVNKFGDIKLDNVPTSGFVKLNFSITDWSQIQKAHTEYFITPRQLKNE
jgi:phosphohistidine phosphatase